METMRIIETKIEELSPYYNNAKQHPERQVKKIANSIRQFGFLVPILVDKDNNIIAGHGRYIAAQLLGLPVVPTMTADHLTEDQVRAYRLADNKLAESDIDIEIVKAELRLLDLELIDLTGYNANILLDTQEDDPDLLGATKPQSELGDVYELGPHKLICGDSTEPATYKKLLGNEKARLIFTDPPYSIDRGALKQIALSYPLMPSGRLDTVCGCDSMVVVKTEYAIKVEKLLIKKSDK